MLPHSYLLLHQAIYHVPWPSTALWPVKRPVRKHPPESRIWAPVLLSSKGHKGSSKPSYTESKARPITAFPSANSVEALAPALLLFSQSALQMWTRSSDREATTLALRKIVRYTKSCGFNAQGGHVILKAIVHSKRKNCHNLLTFMFPKPMWLWVWHKKDICSLLTIVTKLQCHWNLANVTTP